MDRWFENFSLDGGFVNGQRLSFCKRFFKIKLCKICVQGRDFPPGIAMNLHLSFKKTSATSKCFLFQRFFSPKNQQEFTLKAKKKLFGVFFRWLAVRPMKLGGNFTLDHWTTGPRIHFCFSFPSKKTGESGEFPGAPRCLVEGWNTLF